MLVSIVGEILNKAKQMEHVCIHRIGEIESQPLDRKRITRDEE
jgi:hypothetical protein